MSRQFCPVALPSNHPSASGPLGIMSSPVDDLFNLEEAQLLATIDSVASLQELPQSISAFHYNDVHDTAEFALSCAKSFALRKKKFYILFAMAIGEMGSFAQLMAEPPFSTASKQIHKRAFMPNNVVLIWEINRRSHFIDAADSDEFVKRGEQHPFGSRLTRPRPGQWKREDMLRWLEVHTVNKQDERDLAFMTNYMNRFKTGLADALLEESANKGSNESFWERKGWQNLGYRCRFIDVISSDEMRNAFVARDDTTWHRTEYDAQNTVAAPKSAWQHMADCFNDETKVFESSALGDRWGHWFAQPQDLSWSTLSKYQCVKLQDGKDMKRKFHEMNNMLGAMYKQFSLSGSGDDMCGKDLETGVAEVSVDSLPTQGGDRTDFLNSRHPSTLYLWFMLLKHDLWNTSCTEFPTEFAAEGGVCPTTLGGDTTDSSGGSSRRQDSAVKHSMGKHYIVNAPSSKISQCRANPQFWLNEAVRTLATSTDGDLRLEHFNKVRKNRFIHPVASSEIVRPELCFDLRKYSPAPFDGTLPITMVLLQECNR